MIKILHLYYDLLNLYGENANTRCIEHMLKLNNISVNVDLKTASETWFTGSTMGHQFVLKLKLCAGGYISASASVTDWVTGGYVTHDVE